MACDSVVVIISTIYAVLLIFQKDIIGLKTSIKRKASRIARQIFGAITEDKHDKSETEMETNPLDPAEDNDRKDGESIKPASDEKESDEERARCDIKKLC